MEDSTVPITIEGYLTETKLSNALQRIVGDSWAGDQITLPGTRRRWDMAFRQNGSLVVVEYDGDAHYRDSLKIKADREKQRIAEENHMRVVRIP